MQNCLNLFLIEYEKIPINYSLIKLKHFRTIFFYLNKKFNQLKTLKF